MGILKDKVVLFAYKNNCSSNVWETSLGIVYLRDTKVKGMLVPTFNMKFLNLFESIN